jgi:hypothetical protein
MSCTKAGSPAEVDGCQLYTITQTKAICHRGRDGAHGPVNWVSHPEDTRIQRKALFPKIQGHSIAQGAVSAGTRNHEDNPELLECGMMECGVLGCGVLTVCVRKGQTRLAWPSGASGCNQAKRNVPTKRRLLFFFFSPSC